MRHLWNALRALWVRVPRRRPADAAEALRSGRAVLVDVRERGEWASGVAEGAVLLPLTDLVGRRADWDAFLRTVGEREVLLYCKAGGRSTVAAKILRQEGFVAADAGSLREWKAAGWRIRMPDTGRQNG
jgi:rhodanese-related sulfurtransferase